MRTVTESICGIALALASAAPLPAASPVHAESAAAIERAAHGAYVAAINSNDVAKLAARLTDNVVFQALAAPEIVGKAAVRAWAADYVVARIDAMAPEPAKRGPYKKREKAA